MSEDPKLYFEKVSASPDEFFSKLSSFLSEKNSSHLLSVTFFNPLTVKNFNNSLFVDALKNIDYFFADGVLLAKFLSFYRHETIKRLSFDGNSLAPAFFREIETLGKQVKVAFIGGEEGVADYAAEQISLEYDIEIVRTRNGYFNTRNEMIDEIRRLKNIGANAVVVGMGAPYQEYFLQEMRREGLRGVAITCGGYFDQIVESGGSVYYPTFINRYNLRALYRLYKEPGRLIPRYTIDYAPFYYLFLTYLVGLCKKRK